MSILADPHLARAVAAGAAALLVASACQPPWAEGPPARLVAGVSDTVVVNHRRPVQIPVRVLDPAGHVLSDTGVRFQWTDGLEVPVSAEGIVTCNRSGDATVRATLGLVATSLMVRCRPVRILGVEGPVNLVLGDSARDLPVVALGPDLSPVDLLRMRVIIEDSSVAVMEGQRVRARAPGGTFAEVRAGEQSGGVGIKVYEPVAALDGVGPERQHLAIRLTLRASEQRRYRIPAGEYMLWMLPYEYEGRGLQIRVAGASCESSEQPKPVSGGFANPPRKCHTRSGAWVIVSHPSAAPSAPAIDGTLLLRRLDEVHKVWHTH